MTKIKFLFAFAAVFFVALSSFSKPKFDTTVYGKDASGNEHAVLLSQQGITWDCNPGSKFCTYSDIQMQHPRESSQSYQFVLLP